LALDRFYTVAMLKLNYKATTTIPVEVEGLVPNWTREKSLAEIEQFQIFHGNQKLPLAEFFDVLGDPADSRIEFSGSLAGVHWIGAHMTDGEIRVSSPAGRHVGSEMTGGNIQVHGDAGDWVGGEMHGGLIHVRGNAGHLIGSAYRGSKRGMTGGTILIDGNVGNEVGHTMRRGLLAVGGNCGDFAGINMISGTVMVLGECGIRAGAGMRRGTVALFGPQPPAVLATFRKSCLYHPRYLQLMFRYLRQHEFAVPAELWHAQYRLYHGDNVGLGRGELLVRELAA
jgi:formylmethanofuran dehydrogenase subunit C